MKLAKRNDDRRHGRPVVVPADPDSYAPAPDAASTPLLAHGAIERQVVAGRGG